MFDQPDHRLSIDEYTKAADALHVLTGMLLFEFARHRETEIIRDQIARNFVARADVLVRGIFKLWEIPDYTACWVLHRTLLDRLFHLHDLNKKDQFDMFSDWSFKMQFEAAERLRSDPSMKGQVDGLVEEPTSERKARYHGLVKNPPAWRRPKAADAAREMDLTFLYRYGYDYASRYVHPMADDGQEDFYNITRLQPRPDFGESAATVVLSNSILIASMIDQEALNASTLSWMAVVYDAIDGVRNFLGTGTLDHHIPLAKVSAMFKENTPLAKRREPDRPATNLRG